MGTLTIRNLDDALKTRLRVRAAAHGHSMEEEARMILRAALATSAPTVPIGDAIAAIFAPLGGFDVPALPDEIATDPHIFDQARALYILDTSVLSGLMRQNADAGVMAWSNLTPPGLIFTTAINLAEIVQGLAHMQDGHRRRALTAAATQTFNTVLAGRVLPFDAEAAHHYGEILARRTRLGRPIGVMDAQIAAIASTHGATVVTRDTAGFTDCGITLLNPWSHPH